MSTGPEKPKTELEGFPADVIGLLQDFLPHVQEVANAALAWQVKKLLEVRLELIDGGIGPRQAGGFALELIKSATKIPAPNAIPFGVPMKTRPEDVNDGQAPETPLTRVIRESAEAGEPVKKPTGSPSDELWREIHNSSEAGS